MIHKYGYSSPTDGTYTIDDIVYTTGVDYRTKERYFEYANVGFDTLLLQGNDPYCGEVFETSQLKKNMDNAYSIGIKRIIVHDKRIYDMSLVKGGLIGTDKMFLTSNNLVEYISFCMKDYSIMPGFIGVMLADEPTYEQFDAIGQLVDAIKKVNENFICQCNLLPLNYECENKYCFDSSGKTKEQCYHEYVTEFCKHVNLKNISMDSYPIREEKENGKFIFNCHFAGLQIFSDVLRDYKREKTFILQSTAMNVCKKQKFRKLNKETLEYQYNIALCLGISDIAYFTYWNKQVNHSNYESFPDNTSFISRDGIKTDVYYFVKQIHENSANIEQLIAGFHYFDMTIIGESNYVNNVERRTLDECDITSDGLFMVSKLVDSTGNTIISVVNILDPDIIKESRTITLTFKDEGLKNVIINNEKKQVNNKITENLFSGECMFVLISKNTY